MLYESELNRAMLIGVVSSVFLAIAGTAVVFGAWRWLSRRSTMHFLIGFLAVLALAGVYFFGVSQLVSGAYQLKTTFMESWASTAYVHPGTLSKLAPALAIGATWTLLTAATRWLARRSNRRPT